MTHTHTVAITRWFSCSTKEVFDAWAEELSGAWIQHSGLHPLIGEFHGGEHSYTFRKTLKASSAMAAIQLVDEGVHRALAHLGPRDGVRMSPAMRIEVDIEDHATGHVPAGEQDGVGE